MYLNRHIFECGVFHILLYHFADGFYEPSDNESAAAIVTTDGSTTCSTSNTTDRVEFLDNLEICLFLKLLNHENIQTTDSETYNLFTITDSYGNEIKLLKSPENVLELQSYSIEEHYSFNIQLEKWNKICITINNTVHLELRVNYDNVIKPLFKNLSEAIDLRQENDQQDTNSDVVIHSNENSNSQPESPDITNSIPIHSKPVLGLDYYLEEMPATMRKIDDEEPSVEFCTGFNNNTIRQNPIGLISGVVIRNLQEERNISDSIQSCIQGLTNIDVLHFSSQDYLPAEQQVLNSSEATTMCKDVFVLYFVNKSGNYHEHRLTCHAMRGRLLSIEEHSIFLDPNTDNRYQIETWVDDPMFDNPENFNKISSCRYFNSYKASNNLPCIFNIDSSFCLVTNYAEFVFYGKLNKFSRSYRLTQSTNNNQNEFTLIGRDFESKIVQIENVWIVLSNLHNERAFLVNETLPFGRKYWDFKGSKVLMTLTHCGETEFACTDGTCISSEYRCSGSVECSDSSDEEECELIQKKHGYMVNTPPLPLVNESAFVIEYFTNILNIEDISTLDGIMVVDAVIALMWNDPRLVFWNPTGTQKIDCNDIWSPSLMMADNETNGFNLKFEPYRSSCLLTRFLETDSEYKIYKQNRTSEDPFMGFTVDGDKEQLTYLFTALITIPCHFDLRRYPFGLHSCKIAFWDDDSLILGRSIYRSKGVHGHDQILNPHLPYKGRKTLGEFYYIDGKSYVSHSKKKVLIEIELQTLYGFHLLNSFIPSLLILIISYASLLFPIVNFNERIMTSLTALLVLVTLFIQANNSSVRTPYFKMLDIWYAVLIIFCFVVVIFQALVHKANSTVEKPEEEIRLKYEVECESGGRNNVSQNPKPKVIFSEKASFYNLVAKVALTLSFLCFLIIYCLGAMRII